LRHLLDILFHLLGVEQEDRGTLLPEVDLVDLVPDQEPELLKGLQVVGGVLQLREVVLSPAELFLLGVDVPLVL